MKRWVNARVFTGYEWLESQTVIAEKGRIIAITPSHSNDLLGDTFDCAGAMLVPAFIDLQVYGRGGKLFSAYPVPESLAILAAENLKFGVANCLVTIATQPLPVILKCLRALKTYWQKDGQGIYGLHLEGPFINIKKSGAHIVEWIVRPTHEMVDEILAEGSGVIKMITLAPESCDPIFIQKFVDAGIVVSAGHSDATYAQGMQLHTHGIKAVTHLFNAMSAMHHREVGLPGAAFHNPFLVASIIPDGIHVSYPALKMAKQLMQDRLYFITDAVTQTNIGPYQHLAGNNCFVIPNGTISGSAIGMLQGVKNAIEFACISLKESLRMASLYPAKLMGLHADYGAIEPNKKAAILLLNNDLTLRKIFIPK